MFNAIRKLFSAAPDGPVAPLPARNAPCHCGSQRKYKSCCMTKDQSKGSR